MNQRLSRLLKKFPELGIDSLFVSCEQNVTYLSGFKNNESFLFITPKKRYFLTDFRYVEQARNEAKGFEVVLRDTQSYSQMVEDLRRKSGAQTVGFEAARIGFGFYTALAKNVRGKLVPTRDAVESLRIIKDKDEIQKTRKSIEIMALGIRNLRLTTGPGMNEKQVQAKLEYHTKMLGSEKPAFDLIIAAGAKSSMPHAVSDQRGVIQPNDILLVDMGTVYDGYHSDLTRCFFMGKIPPLMRKIYSIVLEAQERGIRKVRPGISAGEVDLACRKYISDKGYGKYFGHSTGHGTGLEIHEAPTVSSRSTEILKPGMIITVEPGIYLPGKFGVRIEDMVLVTPKGHEVLTRDIDKRI